MQEANSSTTATARPLPKRTRSTAGLEEIDAWLSQIADSGSSSGQSTTSTSTSTTSTTQYHTGGAPASGQPHGTASSRKRHHSLPTSSLSGSFAPHCGIGTTRAAPQIHGYDDTFATFHPAPAALLRPELSVFKSQRGGFSSSSGRRISNQHSPSLHSGAYSSAVATPRTSNAVALVATLQPPEMSPREDFLVRAFVSDAMKLELDHHRRQYNNADDGVHGIHCADTSSASPTTTSPTTTTSSTTAYSPSPLSLVHFDETPPPQTETPTSHNQSQSHQKWTREEDDRLRDTVTRFGGKSWKLIAETLGNNRTDVQCLHRWNKVLKPGLVKGPWTPDEDRVLLDLIARYGVGQIRWCDVALHLPGRIGKQCRERWCNHLDSSIRKGQWTPEEDDAVFRLQQQMGNKWSEIAKTLPGRTENAVKNRFNSAARRKWLVSQALRTPSKSQTMEVAVATPTLTKPRTSISRTSATTPVHTLSLPASPATPSRCYSSASARRGANNLLSSGLLAGPPRPPTQPFRGVSSVVAPPPLPPSLVFLPLATTTATGLELFPFVDGYHSPLHQQQQPQQHQQPLMFESPGQQLHQHQQTTYSTSNISRNAINDTRSSTELGSPLYQSHVQYSQQQQQQHHNQHQPHHQHQQQHQQQHQHQHQLQHHHQHQPFLQLTGSNTSLIKQEALRSPLGLDHRDERDQKDPRDLSGDNQESDSGGAAPPEMAKRASYYEPQVENGEDDDDHALQSIDIPDCTSGGEDPEAQGAPSSSPVMDDQNMNTFLDSVALELDDMI